MTKTESEMLYDLVQGRIVQIFMTEKRRLKTAVTLSDACLVNVLKKDDFINLRIRKNGETPEGFMWAKEVREVVKEFLTKSNWIR